MKAKKIIVAVSLEAETHAPLMRLKDMDIGLSVEIHMVHIVPVILYSRGLHLSVLTYPLESERPGIVENVLAKLAEIKKEILPYHEKVLYKCFFNSNEKAAFADYVEEQKPDLVVVATRGQNGVMNFFDSSFAQYQLKHSSSNILIVR